MFPTRGGWILIPALVCVVTASSNLVNSDKSVYTHLQALRSVLAFETISQVHPNNEFVRVNFACMNDIRLYVQGVQNGEEWALRMLDATSKLQSGILDGNIVDLGMFDECLRVRPGGNSAGIQGRHCMVNVNVRSSEPTEEASSLTLTSSVCVPASCDAEDIVQVLEIATGQLPDNQSVDLSIAGATCSKVKVGPLSNGEILTITFLVLIFVITVVCTVCDIVERSSECRHSIFLDIARSFSVCSNAPRLLSTKKSPQSLPAIHGIRFLTIFWVVMGHEYAIGLSRPLVNLTEMIKWMGSWTSLYIITAPFAVDTFFALSGFLMSYTFLKEMAKGRRFNVFSYYIHRYIRLTPSLAVMILITIYVLPLVGSGPRWDSNMESIANQCRENWWTNLLYVQNIVNKNNVCLFHSWYLAVDMQLYILSPVILYPLFRWPKIGLIILGLFFAATIVITSTLSALNEYSISLLRGDISYSDRFRAFEQTYITTYTRAGPWLVGILLGYIIVHRRFRISKVQNAAGWFLTICAFAFCAYASRPRLFADYEYNVVWETIDFTLARPIWGAAVAWVIFACTQGYGGPVNAFLSLPIFLPLSRMSYCLYLVHFMLQMAKAAAVRTPTYFSDLGFFNRFWSSLAVSIALSFVFSLLFESPISVLEKNIASGRRKNRSKPTNTQNAVDAEKGIDNKGMSTHL